MEMNETRMANLISGVKLDSGISSTSTIYDERIKGKIHSAIARMVSEGIVIADSFECDELIIAYSSWLWRSRDSMTGMPRSLRLALNNFLFHQKMKRSDS